jgi:hypothetical protein
MTNNKGTKFLIVFLMAIVAVLAVLLIRGKVSPKEKIPEQEIGSTEAIERKIYENSKYGFSVSIPNGFSEKSLSDRQFSFINDESREVVLEGVVVEDNGQSDFQNFEQFVLDRSRVLCAEQLESQSKCLLIENLESFQTEKGVAGEKFFIKGEESAGGILIGPIYAFKVGGNSLPFSAILIFNPFQKEALRAGDDTVLKFINSIDI